MRISDRTINHDRRRLVGVVAASLAAAGLSLVGPVRAELSLPVAGKLPSFDGAVAWLNSAPLTAADLRGKVVLVSFWNFTCINWVRQRPYVRAWAEKYKDLGLVVIGVHAPEFVFEKNVDSVSRDVRDNRITYPIAVDSDHAIWRAFDNEYWPALYFVDAKGRIRHQQFGEGEYDASERVIQQLLAEAGQKEIGSGLVSPDPQGVEAQADWASLKSPETYVGSARGENFASPGGTFDDAPSLYRTASRLPLNWWSLAGVWTVRGEYATANEASGRIAYRFRARDLHLVLAPSEPGRPIRFRITLDGAAPGTDHGIDAAPDGTGTVQDGRLYQLIRQAGAIADRTFEIEFIDPGIQAYAFTFG